MKVILLLAAGGMYYKSVSSLDGLDGDTLGIGHVGAWYERRGDEIVTDLSYYMSSCGTAVWELCWSCHGRVANPHVSCIKGKLQGDGKVFCLRYILYANIASSRHVLGVGRRIRRK